MLLKKEYGNAEVVTFRALSDNFQYLVVDNETKVCAAVDAAQPEEILRYIKDKGLVLKYCLTTHYHSDHSMGNPKLFASYPEAKFYCGVKEIERLKTGEHENIPYLQIEESAKLGDHVVISSLFAGYHTKGHVLYRFDFDFPLCNPVLFTGDALFLCGCGRVFDSEISNFESGFIKANIHGNPDIYCGHEYTLSNIK
eukprot:GHVP01014356.1.p1 GENE.GHVP01014356.1~~GHVP01014356.1.p1  ORF type:complete len:197 (+),score=31.43 GHVP01014356.1:53-643(+)